MSEVTDRIDIHNPRPMSVSAPETVFGGSCRKLLPVHDSLPEEFRTERDTWCRVVSRWFFHGLDSKSLVAKPGIDHTAALAHCTAIMRSWEPKHEHKIRGVAFLMSKWFEPYKGTT